MAITNMEKLIEDWALAWSTEKLTSLVTDDCVYQDIALGVVSHGKAELEGFYNMIFNSFPDFKIELISQFIAGNRAGAEWILSGTRKGDFPGLPATNKPISVRGASIFELDELWVQRNKTADWWFVEACGSDIAVLLICL